MSVILIEVKIDSNNDIKITNMENGNTLMISYEKKYILASSVYEVLSYKSGDTFRFEEIGIDEKTDKKIKQYFYEIVNMFKKICEEISLLKIKDPNDDINEIEYSEFESDLPF